MNPSRKTQLLGQIAAIPAMERGKFSPIPRTGIKNSNAGRRGGITPRHIAADELPAVESALAGHAPYRQLTEEHADLVILETRQNIAAAKKSIAPAPRPPRPGR